MNHSPALDRRSLLISVLLIVMLVIICGATSLYVFADPSVREALILTAVAFKIDEVYRQEVDWQRVVSAGREAIFSRLDRYSSYVDKDQFSDLDEQFEGSYTGIGISVVYHDEGLLVMSVRENGPAAEVGLLSGDIVIGVDSVSLAGLSDDQAVRILRGPEDTQVLVQVYRPATGEVFEVQVVRKRIPFLHIPFAGFTEDSIIYIRMLDFDAGATRDLKSALDSLVKTGESGAKGLILDLRGNPGGLFAEAYRTADLFLEAGTFMVGTEGRSRWQNSKHFATGTDMTDGLPMAVIVDQGSASSAEIVAGALQGSGRAILVGDTTFGKGLVQGFIKFPDGDGVRLTISRYYFEGPIFLNDFDSTLNDIGHGLAPDYYFDVYQSSPFRRALENSLLLGQFAGRHQDEILQALESGGLDDSWVERFVRFADSLEFEFVSPLTILAEDMKLVALVEKSAPVIQRSVDALVRQTRLVDRERFSADADYIKSRLAQTACERKYGTYYAYRKVLIRARPEIGYASQLLLGRNP